MVITALVTIIQMLLTKYEIIGDPQLTSLESGFENLKHGIMISSSFFLLAILFVVFDIELVLFIPLIMFVFARELKIGVAIVFLFFIVLVRLIVEWSVCGLKWSSYNALNKGWVSEYFDHY